MTIDVPIDQDNVLNYSIVSCEEEDSNPLIVRLKLSSNNPKLPVVVLNRIEPVPQCREGSMMDLSPRKRRSSTVPSVTSPTKVRRSLRTPKPRLDLDFQMEDICTSMLKSVKLTTPVKTPKRSTRKRQSPIKLDENMTPKSRKKPVRKDLNESFRRSILRSRHNIDNFDLYDSEEEAIEVVEALKRSEQDVMTPKKRVLRSRSCSTDSSSSVPATPKGCKPPLSTPNSRGRLKMLREGTITPQMHYRSSLIPKYKTPLMKAQSQLHVSYIPASLPCREKEYLDIYNFLRGKLEDGCGGCMYISGVPGTGKTATVTSVIDCLVNDRKVEKFSYVSLNGMKLTEPRQAYVEIWKQLTGKTVPWEQAQGLLEDRFTRKKKLEPVVMLIDELDILCTKRQDVVYNLLDWPSKSKDQLVVITIANTMDLPERLLMSRVTSRLGLTRLTFQAYTHKQLMEIVTKRLIGTDSFNSDAIQLVARKVASVSGDARRALDICRRAAEIAEAEGKGQLVNIMHINEALTAMITQPQVTTIRRSSRLQKLLLQAIVAEIERTGVEETSFVDVYTMLVSCCALDGFKMVSSTAAQRALWQLSASKLILTDQKCNDIYQRVILNVSIHDVYFALKKD
ncbi:origin recognition complex subunit 1 [Euwallacea similis]|uniref:origin recognition complex subunit 1 n=1 Tax=Euwallacea similis TaxID=1736056 RepID=UPI00344BB75A